MTRDENHGVPANPAPIHGESDVRAGTASVLRTQIRNAVLWRSGTQIAGQLVTWGATFLVIRILNPADYGLVAMTGAIMLFLSLVNGYAFANAVIQRERVSRDDLAQLFGILIATNAVLAILQLLAAPLAAAYYREPMVAQLLVVQALLYPTTPFVVLAYAILSREMDFKAQARVNFLSALVIAAFSLGGALSGWGVWTIVIAPLAGAWVRAIGLTIAAKSWMRPRFSFRQSLWIWRFGGAVLAGQVFWFVQSQADIFIVGRYYDAAELGIYSTALFLTQLFVTKVVPPLNEVAFSAYARINALRTAIGPAFLRGCQLVMLAGLPVFAGFALTAEPLVLTVLGAKWAGTIPFVVLLAIAMPLKTFLTLIGPACNAIDRTDIPLKNSLAGAIVMPVAYIVALQWGLIGIAWAWIAGYSVLAAIAAHQTFGALGITWRGFARMLAPALFATLAMAGMVWTVDLWAAALPQPLRLAALVATGAITYGAWLVLFARDTVRAVIHLALDRQVPEPV